MVDVKANNPAILSCFLRLIGLTPLSQKGMRQGRAMFSELVFTPLFCRSCSFPFQTFGVEKSIVQRMSDDINSSFAYIYKKHLKKLRGF